MANEISQFCEMDWRTQVAVLLATWVATLATTAGFLLETNCPAPPPCTCYGGRVIRCDSRNLTSIPTFPVSAARVSSYLYLYFRSNRISSLPSKGFFNLEPINRGYMFYLYLSDNVLTVAGVDDNAFKGIADKIIYFNVSGNNLAALPRAFGKLTHLETLDLTYNPLLSVDPHVLKVIGSTLRELHISLYYVHTWPEGFRYLTALDHLTLRNFKYHIPQNAFKGFLSTLWWFELHNATIGDIPAALCETVRMSSFQMSGDDRFTGYIRVPCRSPVTRVETLTFKGDSLDHIPNVFTLFPNTNSLYIDGSNINHINASLLPSNTSVEYLRIMHSKLDEFPKQLQLFRILVSCNLSWNRIRVLGPHSVANFPRLTHIYLRDNPITSISITAFVNVPNLEYLDLETTKLSTIPQAIETLPSLESFFADGNPIDCDCNLYWMKDWLGFELGFVAVHGTCSSSNMTVAHFVNATIPACSIAVTLTP